MQETRRDLGARTFVLAEAEVRVATNHLLDAMPDGRVTRVVQSRSGPVMAARTRSMIPTRLDAARRFGGFIGAAHVSGMSLHAAGVSRHIGGGLIGVNPISLARLLAALGPFQAATLLAAD